MMKKITFLAAFLIAAMSYGQNLISKGNFEDLTAPADITTTAGTDYWYTTNASGNPRAAVATDGSNNYGVLKNLTGLSRLYYRFDVVSGTTYKLTLKVADQADNDKELTVTIRKQDNTQLEAFVPGSQSNVLDVVRDALPAVNGAFAIALTTMDATLTEHSVNFIATTTETVNIWFQKNKTSGTGGEIYLDDVVFEIDATAGIEDLQKFNFSYAPNPSKDFVRLSAANNIENVEIFNLLGQKMMSKDLNSNSEMVDISNFVKGVYLMNVTIDGSKGSFKIIKE